MEEWQKDLLGIVETVAEEVDRFFQGMNEMVDAFFELTEELTEQVQNNLATEVEQYLQEISAPFLEIYWDLEDVVTDADPGFPYTVEATPEQNPACVGCTNYHGQVYGSNLLVCAMHPHGWDDKNCPDWEQE
ncbi:hypothetical protein H6G76_19885 [Nostoc sp. FACHB-152]|uniref:hypothetical protein n=1 Tax=unclassified Nostoc TaxID=2593658 RepID=UPI001683BE31|nr:MULTISPECIES: hypothetical protein [unclassified Nostoc]MBD2449381.1 hypothetical protein [Nostoc sp. FACHB-152]MBD2470704.1 hypothetical protein [Nostoc sp. FACHB-145]